MVRYNTLENNPATKLLEKDEFQEEKKKPYPKSVFFIISNELCERFSFYGMKAVLVLYFLTLSYNDDEATSYYHIFNMLCYFTPIFGAMIADGFLGKYKTIVYISFIYASGNIILSISSIPNTIPPQIGALIGLLLIAIGTGGIKPCVAAFGGDQFDEDQKKQIQTFFSFFYFAINAGSLISTFLTPIFREDVHCFGRDNCFPLAFGVPAILMIVAIAFFILGGVIIGYRLVPPQGNVLIKVIKCIFYAAGKKCTSRGKSKEHWLDYADDQYERNLIQDIKLALGVLWMFLPLPVFWALFDQQGSRWTLQAVRMNGQVGTWTLKPDQIQVINPLLILAFIPIFEGAIYPLFKKINLLTRSLQRMAVGMLCAVGAFVIAGFVQLTINRTFPVLPPSGQSNLQIINMAPHDATFSISDQVRSFTRYIPPYSHELLGSENMTVSQENLTILAKIGSFDCNKSFDKLSSPFTTILLTQLSNGCEILDAMPDPSEKPKKSATFIRFVNLLEDNTNITLMISKKKNFSIGINTTISVSGVEQVDIGNLGMQVITDNGKTYYGEFQALIGSFYYLVYYLTANNTIGLKTFERIPANTVSVFYLIPQYFVITIGEVLFSITGLEFAYSEAPSTMKSVLQAGWLLTVAFGNVIVIIVAEASFISNQAIEFFLFAALMAATTLIFIIMSYFYKYRNLEEKSHEEEKARDVGHDNEGYQNEKPIDLPPYREKPSNITEISSL